MKNKLKKYLFEYNNLIFSSSLEISNIKQRYFSPTFSRQETVTFLYENIYKNNKINIINLTITFILKLAFHFFSLIFFRIILKKQKIKKGSTIFRTWLVPNSIKSNKINDIYFGKLTKDFPVKNKYVLYHPLGYGNILKFILTKKNKNEIISISILSFKQILFVFYDFLKNGYFQLKNNYILDKKNITSKINYSLACDYFMLKSFNAYLENQIALSLLKSSIKNFFYIFENQSWENAYLINLKKAKTFGYQSSGFSYRFLNFFPTKSEIKFKLYPYKILTVGKIFTDTLNKFGNYQCDIQTFSALRFDYKSKNGLYDVFNYNNIRYNRIVFAFSVIKENYEHIVKDLIDVFGNREILVDLKFHPLFNSKKILKISDLPINFNIIKSLDMNNISKKYDLMLFNDNSTGIEALIHGIKSFEYNTSNIYDETRLFEFNLYKFQLDKNDLENLALEIENNSFNKYLNQKKIKNYINNLYRVYQKSLINEINYE